MLGNNPLAQSHIQAIIRLDRPNTAGHSQMSQTPGVSPDLSSQVSLVLCNTESSVTKEYTGSLVVSAHAT